MRVIVRTLVVVISWNRLVSGGQRISCFSANECREVTVKHVLGVVYIKRQKYQMECCVDDKVQKRKVNGI